MKLGILALNFLVLVSIATLARGQDQGTASTPPPGSSAPHPKRIRIAGNVEVPKIVHIVQPEYPADAHVTGTVVLRAIIATDGTIMKLDYVSGPPLVVKAAIDAVEQWRYQPTTINGEPVQVDTTISVAFALEKSGKLKPQPATVHAGREHN